MHHHNINQFQARAFVINFKIMFLAHWHKEESGSDNDASCRHQPVFPFPIFSWTFFYTHKKKIQSNKEIKNKTIEVDKKNNNEKPLTIFIAFKTQFRKRRSCIWILAKIKLKKTILTFFIFKLIHGIEKRNNMHNLEHFSLLFHSNTSNIICAKINK